MTKRTQAGWRGAAKSATPPTAPATESAPATPEPSSRALFPVVGIGASAGGLAAFEAFFAAMRQLDDTGMAYVIVQHLAPDHPTVLVDIIRRYTRMEVFEAADGMTIRPNCTYVIPPNHDLALDDSRLVLTARVDAKKPRLTVDHFFRSLALAQRERAICIVMSGTGSDGALGLREVKGEGGLVVAQSPETAQYDGMPRSAIATGVVDLVLAPGDMPTHLVNYVRHAFDDSRRKPIGTTRDGVLGKLCRQLRSQTGHDFSQYKETTLLRRIERRMALHQIEQPEDYLRYARENAQEVEAGVS